MKLLLTSNGLSTTSLKNKVKELVGEEHIRFGFIPTAATIELDNKDWLIKNFNECLELGEIDIIDIAALNLDEVMKRLGVCNVIVMGGGNTLYLKKKLDESGFSQVLPQLLESKLYVGISAGSIVCGPSLFASSEMLYGDEAKEEVKGLGLVSFNFRSHLNSTDFPLVNTENLTKISRKFPENELYALDDGSGIFVENGEIEMISEGGFEVFNKK